MKKRITWQLSADTSEAYLYEVDSGGLVGAVSTHDNVAYAGTNRDGADLCGDHVVRAFCGPGAKHKAMVWLVSQFADVAEEVIALNPAPAPEVVE